MIVITRFLIIRQFAQYVVVGGLAFVLDFRALPHRILLGLLPSCTCESASREHDLSRFCKELFFSAGKNPNGATVLCIV